MRRMFSMSSCARAFAGERERQIAGQPQQQEGERRHEQRHQDGEAEAFDGEGEHRDSARGQTLRV